MAFIGELVPAGMTQHVGVDGKGQLGGQPGPGD